MRKKNLVKLKLNDQKLLEQFITKGSQKARTITRAQILLMANDGKADTQIIEALGTARNTIRTVRYRYVNQGLEAAVNEQPRPGAPEKITGRNRAKISAIACSRPPEGRSRWTLRLIADTMVELNMVDNISHHTVQRVLKKTNLSLT